MEQPLTPPPSRRRAKFAIGGGVVAVTLIALVGWAMSRPGAAAFYYTPTEVLALGPSSVDHDLRLNGKVVPGSIERGGLTTGFAVTDGRRTVEVTTDTPLPDAFEDGSEVVALGRFDGGTLTATQVLAKCPSKFQAKA
ncbi:MAG: cytochrome c maturation protein CcmE [Actinomycetota bacterium]